MIVELTDGGVDYSFECIGNVAGDALGARVLPQGLGRVDHHRRGRRGRGDLHPAVPARHRPGVARLGLRWRARAARELPGYVERYLRGEFELDTFITHTMGLEEINEAFDLMHEGKSIRSVLLFNNR